MAKSEDTPVSDDAQMPTLHVAPSPHLSDTSFTTQRMMIDVLIGLSPAIVVSLVIFRWYVAVQLGLCIAACMAAEALFTKMRGRNPQLHDLSAVVTGVVLGLSLPATAPPYIAIIGSFIAIGLGKVVFGGLGFNMFNPAMVGRAFVMLSFSAQMAAPAYILPEDSKLLEFSPQVLTEATPLTVGKKFIADREDEKPLDDLIPQVVKAGSVGPLFFGNTNGSLGETCALALLVGGVYLCVRRSASWEIPVGILASVGLLAQLCYWADLTPFNGLQHLIGGAVLFGAFFIATDPVSSPLTPKGKLIFGVGVGLFIVLIRVLSGYPEGVMFAVLLMNAAVPLVNRWTVPTPLGGPTQTN